MLLTEYLDTIENTEQEQQFLKAVSEIKEELSQAAKVPIVGKTIRALVALCELESIAAFKQSEHYENIRGYNIHVSNLEKGHFSIQPGKKHWEKAAKAAAIAAAVLLLLCLCKRCCCKRK